MLSARPAIRAAARSALAANIVRAAPRIVSTHCSANHWKVPLSGRQARPLLSARSYATAKAAPTEVSSILESKIRGVSDEANLDETGRVLSVG
ncbi:hypothetical protein KL930_002880 [Ogataea haglerorum]|uniref:Uncharacterized protein n=1 Tax=Ogataea haglerorum TaxID=1937702 RepID=A0AAN6I1P9_9ASCO|nr:uncharacterized protein KL911_002863 [Ogataea haglerorum]KAG7694156.1 hypothetical protein KL915_003827 [Ogataea haglerorum]KAG7694857.1 hypothetical protein KL951_004034 [Ogataea haglerorum]KAG7704580.1 hypothetical protein KL914_003971 [Ogataea haglerorum]KAG7704979.1 hypothetical protein KL950_004152 [Ogataea haglerorum]KAG7719035.1 hypothetical protein KL913_002033 [Ogataea haglerorum]